MLVFLPTEKFEKEAAEMNKRSFKYAWVSASLACAFVQMPSQPVQTLCCSGYQFLLLNKGIL